MNKTQYKLNADRLCGYDLIKFFEAIPMDDKRNFIWRINPKYQQRLWNCKNSDLNYLVDFNKNIKHHVLFNRPIFYDDSIKENELIFRT